MDIKQRTREMLMNKVEQLVTEVSETMNAIGNLDKNYGVTHTIVHDPYEFSEESLRVVGVGDHVTSKYGDYGIIVSIDFRKEPFHLITVRSQDTNELISHTSDRWS